LQTLLLFGGDVTDSSSKPLQDLKQLRTVILLGNEALVLCDFVDTWRRVASPEHVTRWRSLTGRSPRALPAAQAMAINARVTHTLRRARSASERMVSGDSLA
jgi:hypothetical protein